jgi:hypothetical protein
MKRRLIAWRCGILAVVLLSAWLNYWTTATWGVTTDDAAATANQLTEQEKQSGWRLLFDGKTLDGWHNFKKEGVNPGWQVKDGALACVDPHHAGDLVTRDKFDWFELVLDYNISEGGNSGIMFHVTDHGDAIWATGPEVQLEDNAKAADPIRCGWLYGLYKPANDANTGKPIDATKPAGQWNQIRIVIAQPPAKSEVGINGVKYYDFVYNSEDFKKRIARSKFRSMPHFAKHDSGFVGLQGDHGAIAFRNIKLRPLKSESEGTKN